MKRSEIVQRLARRHPSLLPKDAHLAVTLICESMAQALGARHRVEIRGFGSFSVTYRAPRLNRNPRTGERVPVPAKHVPHFKAGKELRRTLAPRVAKGTGVSGSSVRLQAKLPDDAAPARNIGAE